MANGSYVEEMQMGRGAMNRGDGGDEEVCGGILLTGHAEGGGFSKSF